jgi:hypothetical protein
MTQTARKSASTAQRASAPVRKRRAAAAQSAADPASAPAGTPTREDRVRELAYSYYEQRGRWDGHDVDDWLRAEAAVGDPLSPP